MSYSEDNMTEALEDVEKGIGELYGMVLIGRG